MKYNEGKFKIGNRVFFTGKYGLGYFGNVTATDHDGQRLRIRTDGYKFCDCWAKDVTNLSRGKE